MKSGTLKMLGVMGRRRLIPLFIKPTIAYTARPFCFQLIPLPDPPQSIPSFPFKHGRPILLTICVGVSSVKVRLVFILHSFYSWNPTRLFVM